MAAAGDKKSEIAKLVFEDGSEHQIKVLRGTLGQDIRLLDIRDLYAKTNSFTYDPGFTSTASCSSAITYLDGPKGVCLYRGYPVADLCRTHDYMDVAHLLLNGELPTAEEKALFVNEINDNMMIHERFKDFFKVFRLTAHPMSIMVSACGSLASFYSHLGCDPANEAHREMCAVRIVAKMPTLAAMAYKTHIGEPFVYPRADLSYAENFLRMMFATPMREYTANPVHVRAIDRFLTIHADHEQNASTSTVRIAGSSQANPYTCIAAGVACLWGPAHGGANEAVLKMLGEIGSKERIPQFIEDVKNKKDGVRLMGFGHRVYKNFDPRAIYMKELCHEVFASLNYNDPQLEIAQELERIALSDDYFKKRNLYPNVDFYSGLILRAIGIPTEMFTVMFAMSRTVGWISHWNEMVSEAQLKIGRPRQLYSGVAPRSYPVRAQPQETRSAARPSFERRTSFSEHAASQELAKKGEAAEEQPQKIARESSFRVTVPNVATR